MRSGSGSNSPNEDSLRYYTFTQFGQVLSVLLLVLLFLSLSERLFTKEVTNEGSRDTSNTVSYRQSTELAEFLHSVKKLEEGT